MLKNFFVSNWKKITVISVLILVAILIIGSIVGKKKDVKTDTVKQGQIKEELVLSGTVNATNYANLGFESSGKISYVGVKEGDKVQKGKLLTKLDTVLLNSTYQRALSDLRSAEVTLTRVYDDLKNHSTDETYTQKETRTTYEVAKDKAYEAVIMAKKNLDGASIFAPFSGIVTNVENPFTGINVLYSQPQIELIDPTTIYFEVLADQTEVTKLYVGQKVNIILDSFENENYSGEITNISFTPKTGESGSSYVVKVKFNNVDLEKSSFKIGMTGDAKFVVAEKQNILYVPNSFVNSDKNGKYIRTNPKNGKIYIETGLESEDSTEIIGDIKVDQVIYD